MHRDSLCCLLRIQQRSVSKTFMALVVANRCAACEGAELVGVSKTFTANLRIHFCLQQAEMSSQNVRLLVREISDSSLPDSHAKSFPSDSVKFLSARLSET
ncbi:uncharacterized protein LOC112342346 isoform X2 [Selaginella moellendorffii]|uniref:uncharacterized protein LOC112342346 isoform X2 n=1 Tax=Selaginella moellendorffii TaxID=88036 RepID=UPI000D1CB96D|nr:uncharacterized protein LOC112342346 isoform X2 [Selaginella moellendorffii]|eukprot:XP_024519793.1 uncharacterized protein LOC112342346 isoform X2 [Selaginella moellendorffii]